MPSLESFSPEINNPPVLSKGYLVFVGQQFVGVHEDKGEIEKDYLPYLISETDSLLMTDELKVFIPFHRPMGHFMLETLSEVTRQIELRSGWAPLNLVVQPPSSLDLNDQRSLMEAGATVIDYFLSTFDKIKEVNLIKLQYQKILGTPEILVVPAKNIQVFKSMFFNVVDIKRIRKFCLSLPDIKPCDGRKLYLSRRKTQDNELINIQQYLEAKFNPYVDFPGQAARIFSEEEVESFVEKNIGFEVVFPETKFVDFRDQIGTISRAKVLMSSTSSGLLNMFFMPENSTIIELVTPLISNLGPEKGNIQSYHTQYSIISYALGFEYIGIPHNRLSHHVIEKIKSSLWYSFQGSL